MMLCKLLNHLHIHNVYIFTVQNLALQIDIYIIWMTKFTLVSYSHFTFYM